MKKLVIEKQGIHKNVSVVKNKADGAAIYAVLAGDARGLGLKEMALLLREEGFSRFAVSEPEEAAVLRDAGLVDEEILMLRSTTDRAEMEQLADLNVVCTVGSYNSAVALNALAEARSTVLEAHIQIDVGMGYGGFLVDDVDKVVSLYEYMPNLAFSGIYTQIHVEGKHDATAAIQLKKFQDVLEKIRAAGHETGVTHAAGSTGLMLETFPGLDAVRAGSVFSGRCHRFRGDRLVTIGYGLTALEEPRWIPAGHTVGVDYVVRMKKPARVAAIPVGYENGLGVGVRKPMGFWERLFYRYKAPVIRIGDQKVRTVGGIGARETVLDVTDLKCSAGAEATFDIDPLYAKGLEREYR